MIRFSKLLPLALVLVLAVPALGQTQPNESLLGTPTRLVLSCKNVVTSLTWWTRLGFLPVAENPGSADSAITLTDGQLNITLTKESLPSPIVMFRSESIKDLKDTLDALEVPITYDLEGPSYRELRLLSPNGVHLAVRSASAEPLMPVSGDSNRLCGKNTELSIGTGFIKLEKNFWDTFGFTVKREASTPYNYALMTDGAIVIGMHENRDIPVLTMTYFAENMPERIKNIKTSGIELSADSFTEDAKQNSAVLTSPDGQQVFLFTGNQ